MYLGSIRDLDQASGPLNKGVTLPKHLWLGGGGRSFIDCWSDWKKPRPTHLLSGGGEATMVKDKQGSVQRPEREGCRTVGSRGMWMVGGS